MNTASMFYASLSQIDFAYIDASGWLRGESYNPAVEVTGELNGSEQVVADFSSCKADIKSLLDNKRVGLDHKLWLWSSPNVKIEGIDPLMCTVETPSLKLLIPNDGVAPMLPFLDYEPDGRPASAAVQDWLGQRILQSLKTTWPEKYSNLTSVKFSRLNHFETPHTVLPHQMVDFTYTHGLAHSTSWGCNLIAHGHRSYLYFLDSDGNVAANTQEQLQLLKTVGQWLDGKYVAAHPHFLGEPAEDSSFYVSYTSSQRGAMKLEIRDSFLRAHEGEPPVLLLSDEPTIENLAAFIVDQFWFRMGQAGIGFVVVSEGAVKGAIAPVALPSGRSPCRLVSM